MRVEKCRVAGVGACWDCGAVSSSRLQILALMAAHLEQRLLIHCFSISANSPLPAAWGIGALLECNHYHIRRLGVVSITQVA